MSDESTNSSAGVVYDKKNPFRSTLKRRVLLNREGSAKDSDYHWASSSPNGTNLWSRLLAMADFYTIQCFRA